MLVALMLAPPARHSRGLQLLSCPDARDIIPACLQRTAYQARGVQSSFYDLLCFPIVPI